MESSSPGTSSVPYWVKFKALPEFVSDAVGISVSAPFDPGRKLGINMTLKQEHNLTYWQASRNILCELEPYC